MTLAPLTAEELKEALPDKVKKSINQQLIDQINQTLSEPDMYEVYRENLLSYGRIMAEGKFKIQNYLDAVKYVSFKLMGKTNTDAYSLTFPDKIARFTSQNVASKDIASYITAYNKSKLVNLLMEQSMVPTWVLNQDLFQRALNVQADLMLTANSEKVRAEAANSLLNHLKPPEAQKVELNVGVSEDGSISALRDATLALVAEQRKAIQAGAANAEDVAKAPLVINGESEVVN
jgi:S-adenosylmethionine synthetase